MFQFFDKLLYKLQAAFGRLMQRMADFGAALVWPIERLFQAIGRTLFAGSERVENSMGSIGKLLSWPFRMVWQLLRSIAALLLPKSLRTALTAPFRALGHLLRRLGRGCVVAAEWFNLDRPVMWLVWLLQPIWRPIAAVGGFLYAWGATRNYKQMLWGLPAVLMLLPIALVVGKIALFGNASVAGQYRVAVKKALEEKDYDRAQLYERKLAQLGVDTKLTDYKTAETLAQDGKLEEAYERMQRLAPEATPSYPAAHFWILQRLLSGELDVAEDESLRLSGIHLDHIETLGFEGPDIQLMRAYWFTKKNQLAEAADVLEPLAIRMFDAAIQRMQIDLALKETEEARKDARSVRMHLENRQRNNQPLTSQDYKWWAIAEEVLGDTAKLKSILEAWLEHEPENIQARKFLANINRHQFAKLLHSPRPSAKVLADLLIDSAETSGNFAALNDLVKDLYRQRNQLPVVSKVVEHLVQSLRTTAPICEALGTAAATSGEMELANTLLERAVELDSSRATAWNNYAWVLSNQPEKELDLALETVNRALEIAPDEFRFRETRGQILVGLERWDEAVLDLEYAVNGMPTNKEIHQALADAYSALGQDELAIVHRRRSE